jgi:hypothetical protein
MIEDKQVFFQQELKTLSDLLLLPFDELLALTEKYDAFEFLYEIKKLALQKKTSKEQTSS